MSKRPSLSQSNSPTPPLMDSRMYRFSPVEMCEAVSPTSFAISLKTGTGGKPLRSVLGRETPGAGLGTGTRAAWKAWDCAASATAATELRTRKQTTKGQDLGWYLSMAAL